MEDQVSKMLISVGDSLILRLAAKKQYLLTAPFYVVSVCQSWNVLLALLMIAMITLEHFYKGDKTS